MAVSDLLFPIFLFPWSLVNLYVDSWSVSGPFGLALCKLSWFLPIVSTCVSIQSLVLIAVDRFLAVVVPHSYPLISKKLCCVCILITWTIAMGISSPYLLTLKLETNEGKLKCVVSWEDTFGESSSFADYMLSVIVIALYIPLALLGVLYSIILYKLKSRRIPGEQLGNPDRKNKKINRSVLKMAVATVVGFALCWTPVSIVNLLNLFSWKGKVPCGTLFYILTIIPPYMAQANCAINPFICLFCSATYRQGLKRLINSFTTKPLRPQEHIIMLSLDSGEHK